jgi:hypothetical protein
MLILSTGLHGQIGVVSDIHGFLHVRDSPAGTIIDTIYDGEVFFISVDSEDSVWIGIAYGDDLSPGYVHHSKLIELNDLNPPQQSVPELIFKTEKVKNTRNRQFHGGLNLPLSESFELVKINIVKESDTIQQDSRFSENALTPFMPSGIYSHKTLQKSGKLKLYAYKDYVYYRLKIGDGSEYYESIWVVKNSRIIQRLIGWIV